MEADHVAVDGVAKGGHIAVDLGAQGGHVAGELGSQLSHFGAEGDDFLPGEEDAEQDGKGRYKVGQSVSQSTPPFGHASRRAL